MNLFSRAFDGVPANFATALGAPEALARLVALKRWAPGKPLLRGELGPERVLLAFVPGDGHGRAPTRFEGAFDVSAGACVLRGRFVSPVPTRVMTVLFLAVCAFMIFGGLVTGLGKLGIGQEPLAQVGAHALALVGWLAGVVLFGCFALWNAAPSRADMRELTAHLATALDVAVDDVA